MGELHLEVYIERMKREYKVEVVTGAPQVAYRETITQRAEFNYTHKKQTGGSGQYGKVAGYIEPFPRATVRVRRTRCAAARSRPSSSRPSRRASSSMLAKGRLIGFPVIGVRVVIDDGQSHAVDSSDIAFQEAARGAFREVYPRAKPNILEPIMKLAVEGPAEFQGAMLRPIMQRRGIVIGTTEEDGFCRVEAEVPLAEMFGYSTALRSHDPGQGRVHDGVLALPAGARRGRRRS